MKKSILLSALLGLMGSGYSQCDELFLSEYVEGSNNNKSLEIYNPTNNAIDLSSYRITRWQNGSSVWNRQYSDTLNGMLCGNCTYVVVLDKRNPSGTGIDTQVFAGLQAKADTFLSANYDRSYSMYFNGDDALSLDKKVGNNWLPVDIFGKIGERPQRAGSSRTIGWSDSFPYNNGLGLWVTIDKTLVRKKTVKEGVTLNPNYFNAVAEWDVYPQNTFDSLGSHRCDCQEYPAAIGSAEIQTLKLFPNPTSDEVTILSPFEADRIEVFSMTGVKELHVENSQFESKGYAAMKINVSNLGTGFYLVIMHSKDGQVASARLLRN